MSRVLCWFGLHDERTYERRVTYRLLGFVVASRVYRFTGCVRCGNPEETV